MSAITITTDHIKLLERMSVDWDGECEYGAPACDFKRPFGNSDVEDDISEILGREVLPVEAKRLTIEMSAVLDYARKLAVTHAESHMVGVHVNLPYRAKREVRLVGQ